MRKVTEIYGNPRACAARTLCINFLGNKYTVYDRLINMLLQNRTFRLLFPTICSRGIILTKTESRVGQGVTWVNC